MTENKVEKGFLTSADRKFLRGETEYDSKHSRYERRRSIRDRTRDAFRDFTLLAEQLPKQEREKIFDSESRQDRYDLEQDFSKTIEFIYAGLGSETRFRRVLSDGVMPAAAERLPPGGHGGLISVRFEVEPVRMGTQLEAPVEALKANDINSISGDEARALLNIVRQSELDEDRIDRAVEEWERFKESMEQHRESERPWMEKGNQDGE